ncbi:MAG: DUF481 domain-containing protein [Epsilonproteobacteria bacterium]|nr:MAG: DUF481 domain-containing protein [Campylobacterota bacterium]
MKQLFLFLLIQSFLFGENIDNNSTKSLPVEPVVIEDKSGLSDDEIRDVAKETDTYKNTKKVSIKKVIDAIDEKGKIDISKIQSSWEDMSPTPKKYDWIQTKSGEWFKGEIKSLYDNKLEFDSDEIGLYIFDFEDVARIKSYQIISVNIENLASFPGVLRLKNNKITIVQGDKKYEFDKKEIVSFAPDGENNRDFWSGKITFSLDMRSGNTSQYDYSAKANLKRRTSDSRLYLDYLGRISGKENIETANDHRINEKYDVYLSRKFFWTPLFTEFYTDKYKNITAQYTAGFGVGYTVIDTSKLEISFSGGPAVVHTAYESVEVGEESEQFAPALEVSTKIEYEINKITDFTFDYKLTYTDEYSGIYKHHMVATFENELFSWLDFDVTGVWDYVANPAQDINQVTPKNSDYQLLVGLGIEF